MTNVAIDIGRETAPEVVARPAGASLFLTLLALATAVPWLILPYIAHSSSSGLTDQTKTFLIFLGSGVHVAASYAFYFDPALRPALRAHFGRYYVAPVLVVLGTGAVLAGANTRVTATVLLSYVLWQTHHYTRQNVGVFSFACRARRSLGASDLERAAITTAGFAGVIGLLSRLPAYLEPHFGPLSMYAHNVASVVYLGALCLLLLSIPRAREAGDWVRFAFLIGGVLFYLPTFIYSDVFSATASYAIAHGLQYLVFMGYVASTKSPREGRRMLVVTAALAGLGGLLLWQMQYAGGRDLPSGAIFGVYLGLVMVHFIIDAGIWRLSDPFQRRYMAERFPFL